LTLKLTKKTTTSETAKQTVTVAGSTSRAGASSWQHVCAQYRLNDAAGASNDLLQLFKDGNAEGSASTAADHLVNFGRGGHWIIGAKKTDAPWDHFSAMKVTPDAEASGAWTKNSGGTHAESISSDGILTMGHTGDSFSNFVNYGKTTNINLASMTLETKVKLSSATPGTFNLMTVGDLSMNRQMRIQIGTPLGGVSGTSWQLNTPSPVLIITFGSSTIYRVPIQNADEFNVIRVTSLGATNPVVSVYVNGVCVFVGTNSDALTPANDFVVFGTDGQCDVSCDMEYFAYHGSGASVYSPAAADSSGFIDDLSVSKSIYDSLVITQLMNNPAISVFGYDRKYGVHLPPGQTYFTSSVASNGQLGLPIYFASDGKTSIKSLLDSLVSTTGAIAHLIFGNKDFTSGVSTFTKVQLETDQVFPLGLQFIAPNVLGTGTQTITGTISLARGEVG
jgi:hypothetical protein